MTVSDDATQRFGGQICQKFSGAAQGFLRWDRTADDKQRRPTKFSEHLQGATTNGTSIHKNAVKRILKSC